MTTHYFEFDFTHKGKTIPATCFVYYHEKKGSDPIYNYPMFRYPMYRIAIGTNRFNPDVFVFYEVSRDDKKFFWYPLPDLKEEIAKSIGDFLELFDYRRTKYEVMKKPFWAK